jgi:hypothetical protein
MLNQRMLCRAFQPQNYEKIEKVTTSERSRGTCCAPFPNATAGENRAIACGRSIQPSVNAAEVSPALSFVIPSEPRDLL